MDRQLIPPPELAPPVGNDRTMTENIKAWMDLYDATERLVLAGLRREIGPEGDLREAYRRWWADKMAQRDEEKIRMLKRLAERQGSTHGG